MYQKMMFYVGFFAIMATVKMQAADQPLPRTGRCDWGALAAHLQPERKKYATPATVHIPTEILAAYHYQYNEIISRADKALCTELATKFTTLMNGERGSRCANNLTNRTFSESAESFDSVIAHFSAAEIAPTVLNLPSSESLRIKCLGGTTLVIERSWSDSLDGYVVILFQPKPLKLSSSKSSGR